MTRFLKSKDGKFAGSIGNGKTAPCAAPTTPPEAPVRASKPAPAPEQVYRTPEAMEEELRAIEADPTEWIRPVYEQVSHRYTELSAVSTSDDLVAAAQSDATIDQVMSRCAHLSLRAQQRGEANLMKLWSSLLECLRYCRTANWTPEIRQLSSRKLIDNAADLVEYMRREEYIREQISRGFGRDLSETLEDLHRRAGTRDRGW